MKTLKIGVTGGIGSGKTVVCKLFALLGIPVFDADREAKKLMITDVKLVQAIRDRFGDDTYLADGTLNRAYLADIVFNNKYHLEQLNALVHPVAIQAGEDWAAAQVAPYAVKEAALLFESGSFTLNRYNILVTAPEAVRIARVMARDGLTQEQVMARMQRQWPDERKMALADFVIDNDGKNSLIHQLLELDRFFRSQKSR